jgi:hypothetical protein
MGLGASVFVRRATEMDAAAAGRLLHCFNGEFGEPTPPPEALADRLRQLVASGDTIVLLAGPDPVGVAVLRLRGAIWSSGLECYLAELYVTPEERGHGMISDLSRPASDASGGPKSARTDYGASGTGSKCPGGIQRREHLRTGDGSQKGEKQRVVTSRLELATHKGHARRPLALPEGVSLGGGQTQRQIGGLFGLAYPGSNREATRPLPPVGTPFGAAHLDGDHAAGVTEGAQIR